MAGGASGGRGVGARGAVVADTNPLIALDRIDRLDLLGALFERVLVPPAVVSEFKSPSLPAWLQEQSLTGPIDPRVLDASLDPGEREAIALALAIDARRLLIDELPGRLFAQRLRVPVTGTIGVLILAKEAGLLPTIRERLDDLRAIGFRMHATLPADALRQASGT